MTVFALEGAISGDLLTLGGRVLTHDNAAELEFLIPAELGAKVVKCPPTPPELMMSIKDHPGLSHVRWPLRREDFR